MLFVHRSHAHVHLIIQGAGNGESMVWKDPSTGETFVVDTRTGNSYPQDAPPGHDYAKRRTLPSSDWVKKTKDPFCIADTDESEEGVMPQWLQHALKVSVRVRSTQHLQHS